MIEKRKNISTLIKLADKLNERGNNIKLVLVGRPGYGFEDINCELQKRSGYIKYFCGIKDGVLKYIYNSAFAFVFPSNYEGFGSPPLEAMKSGIPVLASNCSSLPEIVGNGGLLFDPDDCEGFYNAVIKMDSDKDFYDNLKIRAVEQAKKFNTDTMIHPLLAVFNKKKTDSRNQ
jgi:glycosyltransferase involved in cell wall biosynthesis